MNEETVYNRDNVNDEWTSNVAGQPISGEIVERVNKNDLAHVTVPGCTHIRTSRQPSTEFKGMTEVLCERCPIGWYESRE